MNLFTQTWLDVLTVDDFERITDVYSTVSAAIQPQYAHSPRLRLLCDLAHDEVDATDDLEKIREVSSLDSSYGVFLDWLGERIGASRTLDAEGQTVELDDLLYSTLLKWKLAQNIAASDSNSLNVLIKSLTGTRIPVVDTGAMTMTLEATDGISSESLVLLRYFAPELKPAGVGLIFIADYDSILGFSGQKLSTFNYGVFNTASLDAVTTSNEDSTNGN